MNRHDRRLQEREDRRTNKEAERYAQMIIKVEPEDETIISGIGPEVM